MAVAGIVLAAPQLGGGDFSGGLIVSAVYDGRDVAQTVEAFDQALQVLQGLGSPLISRRR